MPPSAPSHFLGLDLAFPGNPSAWALLEAGPDGLRLAACGDALTDGDILALAAAHRPRAMAIDAPLSRPRDPQAPYRAAERELRRRGLRLYPSGHNSFIRPLVERGPHLKSLLEAQGYTVLEVYPYACFAALLGRLPAKKRTLAGREQRRAALAERGLALPDGGSHHHLDAAVAAYTACGWAEGEACVLGEPAEGQIWLPVGDLEVKYHGGAR